jgi:hypothetical protein
MKRLLTALAATTALATLPAIAENHMESADQTETMDHDMMDHSGAEAEMTTTSETTVDVETTADGEMSETTETSEVEVETATETETDTTTPEVEVETVMPMAEPETTVAPEVTMPATEPKVSVDTQTMTPDTSANVTVSTDTTTSDTDVTVETTSDMQEPTSTTTTETKIVPAPEAAINTETEATVMAEPEMPADAANADVDEFIEKSSTSVPSTEVTAKKAVQVFLAIDTENDGKITEPEWVEWQSNENANNALFADFDLDGDGDIELSEYLMSFSGS